MDNACILHYDFIRLNEESNNDGLMTEMKLKF